MMRRLFVVLWVAMTLAGCARDAVSSNSSGFVAPPPVQRGLVLPTWERHGYQGPGTDAAVRGMAAVGAGWVQIVPTWYQAVRTSTMIEPTDASVDDDDVRRVIDLAHAHGLKVLLKPHVDVLDGADRAHIRPADRKAWFRSYRQFITHYARLAHELGVEQFAVGTELAALSDDRPRWLPVVADVRDSYDGPIVYAANHNEYPTVAFWDAVDLIGIDAYWPLSAGPTTDVARLEQAFAARRDDLAALAARVDRRILFTEAGFASQRGAVTAPWSATLTRQPAQDEQAAAYEALLATFTGQPWWAGVFWWTWTINDDHNVGPSAAIDHSVRGKTAESVLRRWWAPQLGGRLTWTT
jgi:hypothetical protein